MSNYILLGPHASADPLAAGNETNGKNVKYRATNPVTSSPEIRPGFAPGDPGDPTNETPKEVCPGEDFWLSIKFEDKDFQQKDDGNWVKLNGKGPYAVELSITGDAEFDSANSATVTKTVAGSSATNIHVFIKSNAFSNGRPTSVTLTCTLKDNAPAVVPPATGSTKDNDFPFSWTFVKRTATAPTGMHEIAPASPHALWLPTSTLYTYQMTPNNTAVIEYANQIVTESFGTITAYGFTADDLKTTWKTANPDIDFVNDPDALDKVAQRLFSSGTNGSFVINSLDQISDHHVGMGGDGSWATAFKPAAWADDDGFGFNLPQTYSCCGDTVGNYTVTRSAGAQDGVAVIMIKKTGP